MNNKKIYILLLAVFMVAVAAGQTDSTIQKYSNNGRHKGFDFNIVTGYHVGVGDFKNAGSIPVEIGLGKQFHPNLYVGLGAGAWFSTEKDSKPMIPITADAKLMFPLKSTSVKPIFTIRLGYLLNTASGGGGMESYGEYEYEIPEYDPADFIMMEIMPGVQFPVNKTIDFMLSTGYTHGFATKGGGGGGYFTVKLGLNFHKDPNKVKYGPRREKVQTRNKGLQFTLEGSTNISQGENFGFGSNLACTYKLNPHFSVGGGVGYEELKPFKHYALFGSGGEDINVICFDQNGNYTMNTYSYEGSVKAFKFFARGTYRITDRRLSPFVSVDAGMRLYSFNKNVMQGYDGIVKGPSKVAPFVNPAIGLSLRTTNNSYIELKVGYELAPTMKAQKGYDEASETYISTSKRSLSQPFLSLGFTHTFGKRGKRLR